MARHPLFSCLLATIALTCLFDSRAAAVIDMPPAADTSNHAVEAIRANAEEIEVDVQGDGTCSLKLSGKVSITTGNFQASGENVKVALTAKSKVVLDLKGKVRIHIDTIRGSADRAEIDLASGTVELNGDGNRPATLHGKVGGSDTGVEATLIRFNSQKNSIESSEAATIQQKVPKGQSKQSEH